MVWMLEYKNSRTKPIVWVTKLQFSSWTNTKLTEGQINITETKLIYHNVFLKNEKLTNVFEQISEVLVIYLKEK